MSNQKFYNKWWFWAIIAIIILASLSTTVKLFEGAAQDSDGVEEKEEEVEKKEEEEIEEKTEAEEEKGGENTEEPTEGEGEDIEGDAEEQENIEDKDKEESGDTGQLDDDAQALKSEYMKGCSPEGELDEYCECTFNYMYEKEGLQPILEEEEKLINEAAENCIHLFEQ